MNFLYEWQKKKFIRYLKADPAKISADGKMRIIPAFQSAAKDVPAYKKLLAGKGVVAGSIKDIEAFRKKVPVIDKSIFSAPDISSLCRGGTLKEMKSAMVSSGTSETSYSYGISTRKEVRKQPLLIDFLLDLWFGINQRRTLVINSLGMGTCLSPNVSFPVVHTSVRPDMVIELVNKFAAHFEQFIIIGNTYFMKKVIEDGIDCGLNWKTLPAHFIIGEDWFPENYRDYLAGLLGVDFRDMRNKSVVSNMGLCEFGLTLFRESMDTIRIRRLAQKDTALRYALFGQETEICPELFQYDPYQIFPEEINGELLITDLSRNNLIPLIRYNTKDRARIYAYNEIKDILTKFNYQDYSSVLKLPLISIMGRTGKNVQSGGREVAIEEVKAGLYSDFEAAAATTGYFRISKKDGRLIIEVQLKEKREPSEDLKKKFFNAIMQYVKVDFELVLYPYKEFPYGMGLIYEQKFKYV